MRGREVVKERRFQIDGYQGEKERAQRTCAILASPPPLRERDLAAHDSTDDVLVGGFPASSCATEAPRSAAAAEEARAAPAEEDGEEGKGSKGCEPVRRCARRIPCAERQVRITSRSDGRDRE